MRCPVCPEGESRVYVESTFTTAMGYQCFFDEFGLYHLHDPNKRTSSYYCGNGHRWTASYSSPCPTERCGYQKHPYHVEQVSGGAR